MKKIILILCIVAGIAALIYLYPTTQSKSLRISIIIPVQHAAFDDIINGFKNELSRTVAADVRIDVENAMGDINLQKSAIGKAINQNVDLLVPVGKGASLMALNLAPKQQPILFLAAFITPESIEAQHKPELMGVIDEIPLDLQLNYIKVAMPELKKLALVYVSSDKIFDDVKIFIEKAQAAGIKVQNLMVQNMSELYTVASRIESDNQAIFTLKDVMVASGINALVQQANNLKIPLITSDEGTVKNGAAFAVGVDEADIGRQGASIAAAYFNKTPLKDSIQYMKKISVFINQSACLKQGIAPDTLKNAALSLNLTVIER